MFVRCGVIDVAPKMREHWWTSSTRARLEHVHTSERGLTLRSQFEVFLNPSERSDWWRGLVYESIPELSQKHRSQVFSQDESKHRLAVQASGSGRKLQTHLCKDYQTTAGNSR